jgi:hypothetical protein
VSVPRKKLKKIIVQIVPVASALKMFCLIEQMITRRRRRRDRRRRRSPVAVACLSKQNAPFVVSKPTFETNIATIVVGPS